MRHWLRGHDHRPVAVAHAGAAGAQNVLVVQESVGVNADRGQLQFRLERTAIERFDVDQLVLKFVVARVDPVVGQGVKHERVVRIGTMADADQLLRGGHRRSPQLESWLPHDSARVAGASIVTSPLESEAANTALSPAKANCPLRNRYEAKATEAKRSSVWPCPSMGTCNHWPA